MFHVKQSSALFHVERIKMESRVFHVEHFAGTRNGQAALVPISKTRCFDPGISEGASHFQSRFEAI
jgi:hypothetical protein